MRHRSVALCFLTAVLTTAHAWAAGVVKWQRCVDGLEFGDGAGVVALSIGGRDYPTLYAIVDGKGLFRSVDQGQTWSSPGGEVAADLSCIAALPDNGQFLYAGRRSTGKGLWFSSDGGGSWSQSATAAQGLASDDIDSITFVPGNQRIILLGHRAGTTISVSTDAGRTWRASPFSDKTAIPTQFILAADDKRWLVATRGGDMQQQTKAMALTSDGGTTWTAPSGEFDYFAGPLPVIQAGEAFFSTKHHGTNRSEDAGATWAYKMESHTRVVGSAGNVLFREGDRTFLRGTQNRILNLEVSDNLGQSWTSANGNLLEVIPADLKPLITIPAPKDPFAHIRLASAWTAAADGRNVWLSLGKAGLYHGTLLWTPNGPRLAGIEVKPLGIPEGITNGKVTVQAWASMKRTPLRRVYADLSSLGLSELPLNRDEQASKRYTASFDLPAGLPAGPRTIAVVAEDDRGNLSSAPVTFEVTSRTDILKVFDGERFASGLSWMSPPAPLNSFKAQNEEVHSGKIALEMHGEGSGFLGGGWNWHGWYPADGRTDIRKYSNLSFWVKYEVFEGDRSGNVDVSLVSNNEGASGAVEITKYCPNLLDGQWHEVIIPLSDIYDSRKDTGAKEFDPAKCWMINFQSWAQGDRSFSLYIDDIGFDCRVRNP